MLQRSLLSVNRLEDRTTPAAASFSAGTLTVIADSGSSLTISAVVDSNFKPTGQLKVADHNVAVLVTPLNQPVDALTVQPGAACQDYSLSMGPTGALDTLNVNVIGAAGSTNVLLGGPMSEGNFAFTGTGIGNDTITFNGTQISGDTTIDLKGGDNTLNLHTGTFTGKLFVAGGPASDHINVCGGGQVNVGGNAQFNLGDGDNHVDALGQNMFKVGKDLTYTGGTGPDQIDFNSIAAPMQVGGKLAMGFGKPTNPLDAWYTHGLSVGLGATFTGARANIALMGTTTIGGTLATTMKGGVLQLAAGSVGALQYTGGLGNDKISLAADGDVTIAGSFTAHMGNGANEVDGSGHYLVSVGGDFKYVGGAGDDILEFTPFGTSLTVGGNLTAALRGAGANELSTWGSAKLDVAGKMSITGAGTKDLAQVLFKGDTDIKGNLTVALGNGDNTLIMTPFGMLNEVIVEGSFKYVGGSGHDEVDVDRLHVLANLKANLGTGSTVDILRFGTTETQPVIVNGNLTISSKAVSHVDLLRTHVGGNLLVSTGNGPDAVQMDDSIVYGSATFNLGGGADLLNLDTLMSMNGLPLAGVDHFVGTVTVNAGGGSDTLDFSSSSGNGVNVDGKVNLIGGAGQDQFHTGAGNQYLGTKKEDFELGDSL